MGLRFLGIFALSLFIVTHFWASFGYQILSKLLLEDDDDFDRQLDAIQVAAEELRDALRESEGTGKKKVRGREEHNPDRIRVSRAKTDNAASVKTEKVKGQKQTNLGHTKELEPKSDSFTSDGDDDHDELSINTVSCGRFDNRRDIRQRDCHWCVKIGEEACEQTDTCDQSLCRGDCNWCSNRCALKTSLYCRRPHMHKPHGASTPQQLPKETQAKYQKSQQGKQKLQGKASSKGKRHL